MAKKTEEEEEELFHQEEAMATTTTTTTITVMEVEEEEENIALQRFIKLLAHQLANGDQLAHLLPSSHSLQELLRQSVLDLPPGPLRSSLLLPHHFSSFVSALQLQIDASAPQKASPTSLPSLDHPFSAEDPATLLEIASKEIERLCSVSDRGHASELSLEARRRLSSCRDPPLNLVWAMAALEIAQSKQIENESSATSSAALLLGCLKPLIVGHSSASTAMAALVPLVSIALHALQKCSNSLQFDSLENRSNDTTTSSKLARKDAKALQSILRQALSFIVVCRNKEKYSKDSGNNPPTQGLRLSPLLHTFSLLLRALKLETLTGQSDVRGVPELLALMFPLLSKRTIKSLQRSVKVAKIAEIVTIELVLLQLILESIYWRNKLNMQGGTTEAIRQRFMAKMRAIVVHGVAAADHGNDLILDLLLSGLCVCNVLDDKENNLIKIVLYEALLVEVPHFGEMSMVTSASKEKICRTFLKKIAVARDGIVGYRSQDEKSYSNDLLQGIYVPHDLVDWFKRSKIEHKPPENAILNPRVLIGWLLNLEGMEFKAIFNSIPMDASKDKRDKKEGILMGDDLSNVEEGPQGKSSSKDILYQIEPEALFFVDTTGEAEGNGSSAGDVISKADISVTEGKKTRKRKKNGILFHRRTHLTDTRESENLINESMVDVDASDTTEED